MSSTEPRGRLRRTPPDGVQAGAAPPPAEEVALWWHQFDEPAEAGTLEAARVWTGVTPDGERISVRALSADAEPSVFPGATLTVGEETLDPTKSEDSPSWPEPVQDEPSPEEGEAEEESFEQVLFGPLAASYTAEQRHLAAWECYQQLLNLQQRHDILAAEVRRLLDRVQAVSEEAGRPQPHWATRLMIAWDMLPGEEP